MGVNDEQLLVEDLFASHFGASVARVDEADTRRADFRATDSGSRYLVEVKGRHDSTEYKRDLRYSGWATAERAIGYDNSAKAVIRDAVDQLLQTPHDAEEFLLAVVVAAGHDWR